MKFLVNGKLIGVLERNEFRLLQNAESRILWDLYAADILEAAFFGADESCAWFILECSSASEAQQLIATLPSAKAELFDYQINRLVAFPALIEHFTKRSLKLPIWLNS